MQKQTFPEDRWAISIPGLSDQAKEWLSQATNYGLAVGWLIEEAARKNLPALTTKRAKSENKSSNRWTVSVQGLSSNAELWLRESANYGDTVLVLIESAADANEVFPENVTQQQNVHAEILKLIDSGMPRKEVAAELNVTYAYVCMVILRREKARKVKKEVTG
jgi:hypothetical protein